MYRSTVVFSNNLKSIETCHARMHGFKSGVQLTRFEAGRPASKRVKGCESGRNIYNHRVLAESILNSRSSSFPRSRSFPIVSGFSTCPVSGYILRTTCRLHSVLCVDLYRQHHDYAVTVRLLYGVTRHAGSAKDDLHMYGVI